MFGRRVTITTLVVLLTAGGALARKPGEPIKPGWNMFSKQQDVQLGLQAANEIKQQVTVVDNKELQDYVQRIGKRLARSAAVDKDFPFTFTLVNEKSINAFALPGGPMFIHSGLIAAADNEAQVAGVLGHEMAHVILRHGTNQMSKANFMQLPAILAGIATGSNLIAQLTQVGAMGFMLKFSRTAETQADLLGTRIMNDAGYNPVEMARFFEKLEAEGGSRTPQILSDHPNPGNRVKSVEQEITGLPRRSYDAGEGQFDRLKSQVAKLPEPPKKAAQPAAQGGAGASVPAPSQRTKQISGAQRPYVFAYPDNWQVFEPQQGSGMTVAPREGVSQQAITHGIVVDLYKPQRRRDLLNDTQDLVRQLSQSNQGMRLAGDPQKLSIDGSSAMMTRLESPSAAGGLENDWLLTVDRPDAIFYMIFIAPQSQWNTFEPSYNEVIRSIRFSN